jgi:hypothetical protein
VLAGELPIAKQRWDLQPPGRPSYTAAVNFDPTVLKVVLMVPASVFIAAVAPNAISAATKAYSIRSCPDSSLRKRDIICFSLLMVLFSLVVYD